MQEINNNKEENLKTEPDFNLAEDANGPIEALVAIESELVD